MYLLIYTSLLQLKWEFFVNNQVQAPDLYKYDMDAN